MKKQMMIVAFPQAALTIMVTQETEEIDAQELSRVSCFAPDMLIGIRAVLNEHPEVESIYFYGPEQYVTRLAHIVQGEYPYMEVGIAKSGEVVKND